MSKKEYHADIVRRLLKLHGSTIEGFHHGHSIAAGIPQPTSSRVCLLEIKRGTLFSAKAPGQRTHLHLTAELSQAWMARALAGPVYPPIRTGYSQRIKADADRAALLAMAATPKGFAPYDGENKSATSQTWLRHTQKMKADGLLFGVRINGLTRFFTSQAAADKAKLQEVQAKADRLEAQAERKRDQQKMRDIVRCQMGKTHHAAAPKAVKPKTVKPKVVKIAKMDRPFKPLKRKEIFIKQMAKPASAPKVNAEIVHTANTKYISQMMGLGWYEVNVPRLRIGQPGWSMSI